MGIYNFPKFGILLALTALVVASCAPAPTALPQTPTIEPQPTLVATPFPASPLSAPALEGAISIETMPEGQQVVVGAKGGSADLAVATQLLGEGSQGDVAALFERTKEALPQGVGIKELRIGVNKHWATLIVGSDGKAYIWMDENNLPVQALNPFGGSGTDLSRYGLIEIGPADQIEFAQEENGWVVITKEDKRVWLDMAVTSANNALKWQLAREVNGVKVADDKGLIRVGENVFMFNEEAGEFRKAEEYGDFLLVDGLLYQWIDNEQKFVGVGVEGNDFRIGADGVATVTKSGEPKAVIVNGELTLVTDDFYVNAQGKRFKWDKGNWQEINPLVGSGLDENAEYRIVADERYPDSRLVYDTNEVLVGVGNGGQIKSAGNVVEELGLEVKEGESFIFNFLVGGNYMVSLDHETNGVRAVFDGAKWVDLTALTNLIRNEAELNNRDLHTIVDAGVFIDRGERGLAGVSLGISERPVKIEGTDGWAVFSAQVIHLERTYQGEANYRFKIAWLIKEVKIGDKVYVISNNDGGEARDAVRRMDTAMLEEGRPVFHRNFLKVSEELNFMLSEREDVPEFEKFLKDFFAHYELENTDIILASRPNPLSGGSFKVFIGE